MNFEHPTKIVQFLAALVAIPVALAGAYTFYQGQISVEGVCDSLRSKMIGVIDRNVPAEVKFALLHRDAEMFEKKCAGVDPDTLTIFQVTIAHLKLPALRDDAPAQAGGPHVRKVAAHTAVAASGTAPVPHALPVAVFGLSASGERSGWVALSRRSSGHDGDSNFEGFADRQVLPPAVGTRLSALRGLPVWLEPQTSAPNDPAMLQGRLARGACVEVLATRSGTHRQWALVTPTACP
jgi:hypothetical protein